MIGVQNNRTVEEGLRLSAVKVLASLWFPQSTSTHRAREEAGTRKRRRECAQIENVRKSWPLVNVTMSHNGRPGVEGGTGFLCSGRPPRRLFQLASTRLKWSSGVPVKSMVLNFL